MIPPPQGPTMKLTHSKSDITVSGQETLDSLTPFNRWGSLGLEKLIPYSKLHSFHARA